MLDMSPEDTAEVQNLINAQATHHVGLERYKARLGFWQAIWGTIFVSGVAVAIPAAVTVYGKYLDKQIHDLDLQLKIKDQENAAKQYEKEFMTKFISQAVNQDINVRLRFTDYFAHLADEKDAGRWGKFNVDLTSQKATIWDQIQSLEDRLVTEEFTPPQRARFERLVQSYYDEIGISRTPVVPISSPELSDQAPPPDNTLFRIQEAQTNKNYLTFEELEARFGVPVRNARAEKCDSASDPVFLGMLRAAPMLDPHRKVTMLRPVWNRMKSDVSQYLQENPDFTGKLMIDTFECVKADSKSGKLTPNSYYISANVYLDGDDKLAQNVDNWSSTKVQAYEKLVGFMNKRGWIWTPTLSPKFTSNFSASKSFFN